jgi:hypothetical protein
VQLAVYKLNGLQKRGLSFTPSRIHGHQRLYKRYVEPEAVKESTGDNLVDSNAEDRRKIVHEALDGVLYTLIDWWFKPDGAPNPTPTPTSSPVQTTASAVAQPIATNSAIPSSGATTGDFSRIGYYDSATQNLDGLMFLGNYGGDGSGAFDM